MKKFKRVMETPKSIAFDFRHQMLPYTLENSVLADAAGQVLSMVYLKTIREDASAAYSVNASGGLTRRGGKSLAPLQVYCPMDPTKADLALQLLSKGMKDNTIKVDADKVQKVKDFMLKQADQDAKNNNHWIDIIDEYIWTGVDFQTKYKDTVKGVTPKKIANFLKALSATGNRIQVVMLPTK